MSALLAYRKDVSVEEYFRLDATAAVRSEWFRGEMYAMAGGTIEHGIIKTNVTGELHARLKGKPCRALGSDVRVKSGRSGLYAYADATVICGVIERAPEDRHTATNPTVIIEVLSESTADYDLGAKFDRYRDLETMREYVVVHSKECRVQTYRRRNDGIWEAGFAAGREAAIQIGSLGLSLPLADIYAGVELAPAEPPHARDEDLRNVWRPA